MFNYSSYFMHACILVSLPLIITIIMYTHVHVTVSILQKTKTPHKHTHLYHLIINQKTSADNKWVIPRKQISNWQLIFGKELLRAPFISYTLKMLFFLTQLWVKYGQSQTLG